MDHDNQGTDYNTTSAGTVDSGDQRSNDDSALYNNETEHYQQQQVTASEGSGPYLSLPNGRFHLDRSDLNAAIDSSYCIIENGLQKWQCRLCSKCYTSKHNLVSHIMCHVGVRPHLCTVCGKAFKQSAHLSTHLLIHQGIKPHKCPICQRAFSQVAQVKRHVMTHVNKAPYTCPLCRLKCDTPIELQSHLVDHACANEPGARKKSQDLFSVAKGAQLNCDICNRIFVYPSQLREHMTFHSGSRVFQCGLCSMSFIKEHHLRAHQATHTDQRPHKCGQCGRAFSLKGNLQRHILIHKQDKAYQCEICCKRFTQSQTLKMHLITHSSAKPFSCSVCGKSFTRGHNYRGHIAMHRNAKPYKCSVCNSAFTLRGNLKRHFKEKHGSYQNYIDYGEVACYESSTYFGAKCQQSAFQPFKRKRKATPKKVGVQVQPTTSPQPDPMSTNIQAQMDPEPVNYELEKDSSVATYHSLMPVRSLSEAQQHPGQTEFDTDGRFLTNLRPAPTPPAPVPPPPATGEIIHKVHALHAAINLLAIQCGHAAADNVNAIHSVIDELAGQAIQSTLFSQ